MKTVENNSQILKEIVAGGIVEKLVVKYNSKNEAINLNKIQETLQNPIIQLVLAIITVISIVLAIVFYIKGKRHAKIKYYVKHNVLISKKKYNIDGLNVSYRNKLITDLVRSKVLFYNAGNTTLDYSDIAKTDPLKIKVNDSYEILEVLEIKQSESSNLFEVESKDENSITFKFDYISPKDKIVITILHTDSSLKNFDITGKIKGGKIVEITEDDYELSFCNPNNKFLQIIKFWS